MYRISEMSVTVRIIEKNRCIHYITLQISCFKIFLNSIVIFSSRMTDFVSLKFEFHLCEYKKKVRELFQMLMSIS